MVHEEVGTTKPQLLIVEDNFICQKIYLALLGKYYQIELADTAVEALDCLSKQVYHCIISDLGLPDISGMELLPLIRNTQLNKETPIIIISAHINDHIKQTCLQLGANEIYAKPIDSDLLRHVIEKLLAF